MCRLVCTFVVCKPRRKVFLHRGPNYSLAKIFYLEIVVWLLGLLHLSKYTSDLISSWKQTLWTHIRLLLKEPSDLGSYCLHKRLPNCVSRWESRCQKSWFAGWLLNMHAQLSSGARDLNVGLSLHQHPYFLCASIEGCDVTAQLHRLIWAFTANVFSISAKVICAGSYIYDLFCLECS